jgi:hypothetical protein
VKKLISIFILCFLYANVFAQNNPYVHHTERTYDIKDSSTLRGYLQRGQFYGHARYFFMATDNAPGLNDYYANAFGMGIGYETGKFKNISLGLSGFFIYNLFSSDLKAPDPLTGMSNRYELGLFDIGNPENRNDLDRLEDLYIKYTRHQSSIKFGKQHIKTPFINPQDGRMRPTLVEGLTADIKLGKNTRLEAGWLYGISPRSTIKWYSIGQSIGIYPAGVHVDGKRSAYSNNLSSDYVLYAGLSKNFSKHIKAQLWNQYVDNIFNTTLFQVNASIDLNSSKQLRLISAIQGINQQAIQYGGNQNQALTYMQKNNQVRTFGARLGLEREGDWSLTANYNHIGNSGRYLMPREWGRDPFFTFMPRERNEGFGGTDAFQLLYSKKIKRTGLRTDVSYGHFYLPDVKNTALNKYGLPSYQQLNIDVNYQFSKFLKGLEFQFLYVYKAPLGNTYNDPKFIFNKVNMSLYNVVLNYHF